MSYSMKAKRIRPAQLFVGLLFVLLLSAALIIAAPGHSYAAVPEVIPGSQYPENGAAGVPSALEYIRVSFKSNPRGEVDGFGNPVNYLPIKGDTPASPVEPNWKKIRVIELSTNTQVQAVDPATGAPEVVFNDATLVIKVNKYLRSGTVSDNQKRLKPGETYQVIIPQGSIDYTNDNTADHNSMFTWTFTVERKPTPALFSFQPGNQNFTITNGQSTLPNHVDIQGVGYRKSLVVQFQNDIKSNFAQNTVVISGNELSASAFPDTPQTELSLDEGSANTLIVKLKNENPLKPNHLYTVTINSDNLEDAESDLQRYFAAAGSNVSKPVKPTPVAPAADITQAKAIEYANLVARYAYNYIYAYLPNTAPDRSYKPGNAAAKLANNAYYLIERIRSFSNLSAAVTSLETDLNNFIADADVTSYTYASTAAANSAASDFNVRYPLKNDSFTIRFSTFRDFKATLIDPQTATITNINNTILAIEPPRRVGVVVPKNYIKSIETIHYVQGLVPSMQGNNLTNIDITADIDVDRIVVTSNRGPRILTNKINNVFTAGYSGLETDGLTEVKLQAFDKFGQLLEERNIKLGVNGTNPVKNDYLPKDSNSLGKTYTLYELMADPKLFAEILQHYPVSRLNELGIYLPYTP
jgi:hypothetical protein